MQPFYLEAGKLGLKEFLTERLQPAPLSPGGGGRITEEGSTKVAAVVSVERHQTKCWCLTGYSPDAKSKEIPLTPAFMNSALMRSM